MAIPLFKVKIWLGRVWSIVVDAVRGYTRHGVSLLAAGVSFWAVMSLSPMLVLTLVVTSVAYDTEIVREEVSRWLVDNLGGRAAEWVLGLLESTSAPGATTLPGLASVAIVVMAASRTFTAIQKALDTIWDVAPTERRGWKKRVLDYLWKRVTAFGLVGVFGGLVIVSVAASMLLPLLSRWLEAIPGRFMFLRLAETAGSTLVLWLMTAAIYVVLPGRKVRWRLAWWGSLVTSLMLLASRLLLGWYIGRASLGTYGAAGSIVAFLLWLYFSMLVFLFGAELTRAYTVVSKLELEPKPHYRSLHPVEDTSSAEQT